MTILFSLKNNSFPQLLINIHNFSYHYLQSSSDSPEYIRQCLMIFLILSFNGFDLFVVFYLCNEITVASSDLMYCVFESDWIDQSNVVAKDLIILTEVMKKPQQLIILKLFPMNLLTFTSVKFFYFFL